MTFNIFGAYVLSRRNLMLKPLIVVIIVIPMYLSGGLIPSFLLVRDLKLLDTIWSLLIPGAVSTYNIIVMRTAFTQIPESLEESAWIDGAGNFTLLFRIILPVSLANLAVITLFYAVGHWNSWFSAAIFLRDRNKFPLQLFLREILIANTPMISNTESSLNEFGLFYMDELIKYCTIIVSTVPILCVYPFAQKYFTKGVMIGAIKG